jgi:hypothetical protein
VSEWGGLSSVFLLPLTTIDMDVQKHGEQVEEEVFEWFRRRFPEGPRWQNGGTVFRGLRCIRGYSSSREITCSENGLYLWHDDFFSFGLIASRGGEEGAQGGWVGRLGDGDDFAVVKARLEEAAKEAAEFWE